MAQLQDVGMALQGLSAGLGGRGVEFQQQLNASRANEQQAAQLNAEKARAAEIERKKTLLTHSAPALQMANAGRFDLVGELYGWRSEMLGGTEGADSRESDVITQLAQLADEGNKEAGERLIGHLSDFNAIGVGLGYNEPEPEPKNDQDFMKEERSAASRSMAALRKRSAVINSSFGKISSLIPEINKGGSSGRTAAGAAIMSLARLVSPGVVTEGDFKAMAGAADPMATLMERMSGREGAEPFLQQLQKAYDPTNPTLINTEGLLSIAKSVVGSEAPSILQEYKEADSRARRSGMKERQYNTIFGDSESITGLGRFLQPQENETQDSEALAWARANPNDPRSALILQKQGIQ